MAALLKPSAASPENFAGSVTDLLRVEAALERTRAGRARVTGYVYNTHGLWADQVRLVVEVLDEAGRTVARTTGYVHGMVPPKDRAYFDASVDPGGARRTGDHRLCRLALARHRRELTDASGLRESGAPGRWS